MREVRVGRTRRADVEGRRVRRDQRRLQPRRRAARPGTHRGRLRRLPVARLQVPLPDRRGRARLRGGRVPSHAVKVEDGRVLVERDAGDAARQAAARAPPARARDRARAGPVRVLGHLDDGHGRDAPALLARRRTCSMYALEHARPRAAMRDAADPPARAQVPRVRGLLLEVRARLHLALLDHADGPEGPARPGLRGARALGRRRSSSRRRSAGAPRAASTTRWSSG